MHFFERVVTAARRAQAEHSAYMASHHLPPSASFLESPLNCKKGPSQAAGVGGGCLVCPSPPAQLGLKGLFTPPADLAICSHISAVQREGEQGLLLLSFSCSASRREREMGRKGDSGGSTGDLGVTAPIAPMALGLFGRQAKFLKGDMHNSGVCVFIS